MRLAALAILLFSMNLMLYLIGYGGTPFLDLINGQPGVSGADPGIVNGGTIITDIFSKALNTAFAAAIITFAVGAAIFSGFSAVYAIAGLILAVIFNYVIMPSAILASDTLIPAPWNIVVACLINIIVILTVAEYVRGGG